MRNNDILRSLHNTFAFSNDKLVEIFSLAQASVNEAEIQNWLARDQEGHFTTCTDDDLTTFLNGFIVYKRGLKEDAPPVSRAEPEPKLTRNRIFMKLKIALNLQAEAVLEIMSLAGAEMTKRELSALFRRSDHKHYRECKDEVLRSFLKGVQLKYQGNTDKR